MNYLEIIRIGLLTLCCFCLLFDSLKSSKVGKSLSSSIQNILIRCFDNNDAKGLEEKEEEAKEEDKFAAEKVDFDFDSFLSFLRALNDLGILEAKEEKNFLEDKK